MKENKYDAKMEELEYQVVQADLRTDPSEDAIAAFERSIGYELPADYKQFLLKFGLTMGGRKDWLIRDQNGVDHGVVDVFYGISPQSRYNLGHDKIFYGSNRLPPQILPIASSVGGVILMSLAGEGRGNIFWWHQEEPFGGKTTEFIAKDFDTFLNNLVAA